MANDVMEQKSEIMAKKCETSHCQQHYRNQNLFQTIGFTSSIFK
jgi:hypothetical protein